VDDVVASVERALYRFWAARSSASIISFARRSSPRARSARSPAAQPS